MSEDSVTVYQADTWFSIPEKERCKIKDWLIEQGIDPREISPSTPVVVKNGKVNYWGMTIERSMGKLMKVKTGKNENGETCVVLEERAVDLKSPPPT